MAYRKRNSEVRIIFNWKKFIRDSERECMGYIQRFLAEDIMLETNITDTLDEKRAK
jgi:hypothetical protein